MSKEEKMFEMKVEGLSLDPLTHMPIVILKEEDGERILPIWVGIFEANAIALEMEKVSTPRPMTHDLIKNILNGINAMVDRVVVNNLRDNTFYAEICFKLGSSVFKIDARPSDAIAVALRLNTPIYVMEKVLNEAKTADLSTNLHDDMSDPEKWKKWLENLRPEDFGKYKH